MNDDTFLQMKMGTYWDQPKNKRAMKKLVRAYEQQPVRRAEPVVPVDPEE